MKGTFLEDENTYMKNCSLHDLKLHNLLTGIPPYSQIKAWTLINYICIYIHLMNYYFFSSQILLFHLHCLHHLSFFWEAWVCGKYEKEGAKLHKMLLVQQ